MARTSPSLLLHIRDWLALPFVVTVIIPIWFYNPKAHLIASQLVAVTIAGLVLYASGLALQLYTTYLFWRFAQGTLAPWQPTQTLIIRGPYRYCRNPMITGVLSMLLGEAMFFNSRGIMYWAGLFFVINNIYFFLLEEPSMLARFGDSYSEYKKHVPRWIPRLRPYRTALSRNALSDQP
jgi:protein-S-isoprenylcysteine O-methyltransferase Ste14